MTSPTRSLKFTVYCKPQPQGSSRAFTPKGWTRPVITSDNANLKSFRQEVSKAALLAVQERGMGGLLFGKHEPVRLLVTFYFQKPPSVPKKRTSHVVKPDCSKLVRAAEDSLTGIVYQDDAQIVSIVADKFYGAPERTEIEVIAI